MTLPFPDDLPPNLPHEWVGAANILLDRRRAEQANSVGHVIITSRLTVEVLDVFCRKCRRSYEDAIDELCVLGSQHIGGPRRQPDPLTLEVSKDWPEPNDPLAPLG